jgi:hypothetical protein
MSDGTFANGMATDWMFADSSATGGIFANGWAATTGASTGKSDSSVAPPR